MTPQQALDRLIEGNQRFTSGLRAVEAMHGHLKLPELAEKGQKPFAIVLTCSDSRSPAETIFDQGLGELFVVRVAGNIVAPSLLASIEFAAANFGSSLILVMGHTRCGAVNAAVKHSLNPSHELPSVHLEELIAAIRPAVDITQDKLGDSATDSQLIESSTVENVRRSQRIIIEQSAIVRDLVSKGKLAVAGSVLDIHTGQVNFLSTIPALSKQESQSNRFAVGMS